MKKREVQGAPSPPKGPAMGSGARRQLQGPGRGRGRTLPKLAGGSAPAALSNAADGGAVEEAQGHGVVFIPRLPPRPPSSDATQRQWLQKLLYAHAKLTKEVQQVAEQIERLRPGFKAGQLRDQQVQQQQEATPVALALPSEPSAPDLLEMSVTQPNGLDMSVNLSYTAIGAPANFGPAHAAPMPLAVRSTESFFSPRAHRMLTLASANDIDASSPISGQDDGRRVDGAHPPLEERRVGSLERIDDPPAAGPVFDGTRRDRNAMMQRLTVDVPVPYTVSMELTETAEDLAQAEEPAAHQPRPVAQQHAAKDPSLAALRALRRVQEAWLRRKERGLSRHSSKEAGASPLPSFILTTPARDAAGAAAPAAPRREKEDPLESKKEDHIHVFDENTACHGIERLLRRSYHVKTLADAPGMAALLQTGRWEAYDTDRPKPGLRMLESLYADSLVNRHRGMGDAVQVGPVSDANPLGYQAKRKQWLRDTTTGHHHLRQVLEVCKDTAVTRPGVEALVSIVGFGLAYKGGSPEPPADNHSGGCDDRRHTAARAHLSTPSGTLRLKPGVYQKPREAAHADRKVYDLVPAPPPPAFPDGYMITPHTAPRPPPPHPMAGGPGDSKTHAPVRKQGSDAATARPPRGASRDRARGKRRSGAAKDEFLYAPTPPQRPMQQPHALTEPLGKSPPSLLVKQIDKKAGTPPRELLPR
eukprot:TRINITY_DN16849_c0_g2_i1.p1 TRINITY_DN16849_c0_g2~~TRINITY_DN16849_c0_g2_i1.p1  ORF type:complete len:701 (+),score=186.23 TRINITY_DN16849_c0_g2_i1:2-2104(+)